MRTPIHATFDADDEHDSKFFKKVLKLKNFDLYATDGTANAIRKVCPTLKIKRIGHGPDGGDVHISKVLLYFIACWKP